MVQLQSPGGHYIPGVSMTTRRYLSVVHWPMISERAAISAVNCIRVNCNDVYAQDTDNTRAAALSTSSTNAKSFRQIVMVV